MTAFSLMGVVVGGFLGGCLRYGFSRLSPGRLGTFFSNVLGSLAIGLTYGFVTLIEPTDPQLWLATLTAGFAGGLSTWSTLARECGELVKQREFATLAKYLAATLAIGIIAAWRGGLWAARIYHGL